MRGSVLLKLPSVPAHLKPQDPRKIPGMTKIFPRPQIEDLSERWSRASVAVTEVLDPSLRAQEYALRVTEESLELRHRDAAGLRYAQDTIAQITNNKGQVRLGSVTDWPDIQVRGFMLDVSRDRVPTRETLALLVQRLAALRFNHLQLYIEHTFAYSNHATVWRDASPLTADDMRWLDELCASHGIELAGNQNTFGHMERWLQHDEYRARAETPEGWLQNGTLRAPMSLAPTPQNADLALELVREMTGSLTSRHVNIGCDEVWELGQGASKTEVAERGAAAVALEHIWRIAEPLISEGRTVQLWSDMLDKDPAAGKQLADAGAIATPWWYEASRSASGFANRAEALAEAGYRIWLACGTSGWNSFGGRLDNARHNIVDAVTTAIAADAEGVLLTEWGDNGHQQPPFTTLPVLVYGAAVTWCARTNADLDDEQLGAATSRLVNDATGDLARSMLLTGSASDAAEFTLPNATTAFDSWIQATYSRTDRVPSQARLAATEEALEQSRSLAERAQPASPDGELLQAEQCHVANLIQHGLDRSNGQGDLAEFNALKDRQRELWLRRSRPGGLTDSLAKMLPPPKIS